MLQFSGRGGGTDGGGGGSEGEIQTALLLFGLPHPLTAVSIFQKASQF